MGERGDVLVAEQVCWSVSSDDMNFHMHFVLLWKYCKSLRKANRARTEKNANTNISLQKLVINAGCLVYIMNFSEQSAGSLCEVYTAAFTNCRFLCKAHTGIEKGQMDCKSNQLETFQPGVSVSKWIAHQRCFRNNAGELFIYISFCFRVNIQSAAALCSKNSSFLRAVKGRWKEQCELSLRCERFLITFTGAVMTGIFLQMMCLAFWSSKWNMCQLKSRETKSEET